MIFFSSFTFEAGTVKFPSRMRSSAASYFDKLASTIGLPWKAQEFPFLLALLDSVRNISGELAFALGGSFATNSNVPLSDLDFFLYVAKKDAYSQAESLRKTLFSHPSVITACPIQH